MTFGFQSSKFNSLTLTQELDVAKENNADFFDLFFDDFLPTDLSETDYQSLNKWLINKPVTVHLPCNYNTLSSSVRLQLFEFIRTVKPKAVSVHYNIVLWEDLLEISDVLTSIKKDNSGSEQIKLCVENTIPDFHSTYSLSYINFLFKAAKYFCVNQYLPANSKPELFAAIDTGHAKVNGYSPNAYVNTVIKTGTNIGILHLHDNDGKSDTHQCPGSIPLSANGTDFSAVFMSCISNRQNPLCVIEHWEKNTWGLEWLRGLLEQEEKQQR